MKTFGYAAAMIVFAGCAATTEQAPTGPVRVETTQKDVVPAGTQFAITVDEEIDTDVPVMDETFDAHFTQSIIDQTGAVLVPSGAQAELIVAAIDEGGALGTPTLTLGIRSVSFNGQRFLVQTAEAEAEGREGIGVNPRTGIFVGGGAALGTAIGAIAGGVEGAIIGGVLGGVAGGAAQVITQGDQVKVPAGTTLEFQLDQPWKLTPAAPGDTSGEPVG